VVVRVYAPNGDLLVLSCSAFFYAPSGGGGCVVPPLPSTGTYTVLIDPQNTVAATLNLLVYTVW
jgi:hypothetical protein